MINKKLFLLLLFMVAVGICSGSFFEVYMHGIGKDQLMDNLSTFFTSENLYNFISSFFNSLLSSGKIWLFMLLCPIIPPLALACPLLCMLKGITLGFSATMLVETFGPKGSLYILTTILPHNLLQLPIICAMASLSLEFAYQLFKAFTNKKGRKKVNKKVLQDYARQYLFIYFILFTAIIFTCLFEAFLMQFLL